MADAATGFLQIVRVTAAVDPVAAEYRIAYMPLGGRLRGRQVTCRGLDALTDLLREAGVSVPEIERAWRALARHRFHAVPRVTLTAAQLEALGL